VVAGLTVVTTRFMKNTMIDITKLKHATHAFKGEEAVIIAQCPACAEAGYDLNGCNHLIIYPDGAFACAVNSGEAGSEHRKEILRLVGTPAAASLPPPAKRPMPRPLNRIPTKITYIKLNIRPQPAAEAQIE